MLSVYSKKKDLKGSGIFINEDLTKINLNLLKTTRNDASKVKNAWTTDGKVFVRTYENLW